MRLPSIDLSIMCLSIIDLGNTLICKAVRGGFVHGINGNEISG